MTVTFQTPTLTTQRLILRGPKPSDAEAFVDYYGSERARYTGGPQSANDAWRRFSGLIGHWVTRGFGMFMVTHKDDDTPLGFVGHWFPQGWAEREVGWVLFDRNTEGQGIASEAAQACVDHAWNVLKWDTIVSYIDPQNAASTKLVTRLGAVLDTVARQPDSTTPCLVYRHTRPA